MAEVGTLEISSESEMEEDEEEESEDSVEEDSVCFEDDSGVAETPKGSVEELGEGVRSCSFDTAVSPGFSDEREVTCGVASVS